MTLVAVAAIITPFLFILGEGAIAWGPHQSDVSAYSYSSAPPAYVVTDAGSKSSRRPSFADDEVSAVRRRHLLQVGADDQNGASAPRGNPRGIPNANAPADSDSDAPTAGGMMSARGQDGGTGAMASDTYVPVETKEMYPTDDGQPCPYSQGDLCKCLVDDPCPGGTGCCMRWVYLQETLTAAAAVYGQTGTGDTTMTKFCLQFVECNKCKTATPDGPGLEGCDRTDLQLYLDNPVFQEVIPPNNTGVEAAAGQRSAGTAAVIKVDFTDTSKFDLVGDAEVITEDGMTCLRIDADGEYAKIYIPINPSSRPDVTLEVWVKLFSIPNNHGWLIGHEEGGYDRTILMHDSRFGGGQVASAVGRTWTSGLGAPPVGEWLHVVAVFQQGGDSYVYLNGNQSNVLPNTNNNNGKSYIAVGRPVPWNGHWTDACVRYVAIYYEALSAADVASRFATGVEDAGTGVEETGYYGLGKGGFGLWMADDISKLSDRNQWAGFNNFLDDGYFVKEGVSPDGMQATCPDCSEKLMISQFQDCYPTYETYEEYGKFIECVPYTNKTSFVPKDFNFYEIVERQGGPGSPFFRMFQAKNINGNDNLFRSANGFATFRTFVDNDESFAGSTFTSTVRTVQMAKHCHVTFRDDTLWYIMETQHNQGRQYRDLSWAPGESGHTSYADHMDLLAGANESWKAGPILDLCDCTRAAPNANGCGNEECFALATRTGVECNNCGGTCSNCWDNGFCTHTMTFTQEQFDSDTIPPSVHLAQIQCALCLWLGSNRLTDEYFGSILAQPGSPLYPA